MTGVEAETVDAVDHDRDSGESRGDPSQDPGLGGMGVDDVGLFRVEDTDQSDEGQEVPPGAHLPDQVLEEYHLEGGDASGGLVLDPSHPGDEDHVVPLPVEMFSGEKRVALRSAELEHGDDVGDLDPVHRDNISN